MTLLLSDLRKHMNGAVLDSVVYYGSNYGMNMGVAVKELETIAKEIGCDDKFARFLFRQQVRELKLLAVRIADPICFTLSDLPFWGSGIVNSEIAEHVSHTFLSRVQCLNEAAQKWCSSGTELETYAALLALGRKDDCDGKDVVKCILPSVKRFSDSHLIASAVVKLLYAFGKRSRQEQLDIISLLPQSATCSSIRSEIEWMNEY